MIKTCTFYPQQERLFEVVKASNFESEFDFNRLKPSRHIPNQIPRFQVLSPICIVASRSHPGMEAVVPHLLSTWSFFFEIR